MERSNRDQATETKAWKLRRSARPRHARPEIVEDLEAALEQSREIAVDTRANTVSDQDPEIIE